MNLENSRDIVVSAANIQGWIETGLRQIKEIQDSEDIEIKFTPMAGELYNVHIFPKKEEVVIH